MKTKNSKFKRKLSQLLAGLFATYALIASVQATELVNVEPTSTTQLAELAINNIEQQFNLLPLTYSTTEQSAASLLVQEANSFNVDVEMTIVKTATIAE